MTDIEKWRAILRTPEVCPDQVFVLLDHSDNYREIYGRLKNIFRLQNPPPPPDVRKSVKLSKKYRLSDFSAYGEGYFEIDGEEAALLDLDLMAEIPPPPLPTNSEVLQSLLPHDELTNKNLNISHSTQLQIELDINRDLSPDPHDQDELDELLTQHERYIVNQIRSKISIGDAASKSTASVSHKDTNSNRYIPIGYKAVIYEMAAFYDVGLSTASTQENTDKDEVKEDIKIITEYLRHSKNFGQISNSQEFFVKQELIMSVDENIHEPELDTGMRSVRSIPGNHHWHF
jgi:hypothetical protein